MKRENGKTGNQVWAYIRISTDKQEIDGQEQAIRKAMEADGNEPTKANWKIEQVSSRKKDRDIYQLMEQVKGGDVLYITELSRLARSLGEIHKIINELTERGVVVRVIKQDLTLRKGKDDIATEVYIFAFGIGAQVEREMISERTKMALKAKKEAGVMLGRPAGTKGDKLLTRLGEMGESIEAVKKWLNMGMTVSQVVRLTKLNRSTVEAGLLKAGLLKEGKKTRKSVNS